ncbi:DUF2971 domain-containing protein [Mameliella alba]|uniref:DUF2971 domain-containing protein n=1 Tax=Mameliella alba TaxID=561184 RepID=UPI001431E634|nr:DUF2971 domain-containing protein [Mameliella alba]
MSEYITHYCSDRVFLSFLEKKELWLTSLVQSNDHAEGRWMKEHWLDQFRPKTDPERMARKGARHLMEMAMHDREVLGVCFSEESDLLSQWRGYAGDGSGFSITFEKDKLVRVVEDHADLDLTLCKIAYGLRDHEEVREVIKKLSAAFHEDAKEYKEGGGIGRMNLHMGEKGEKHEIHADAVRALFTVKNPAFMEEREWRIFTVGHLRDFEDVNFRATGNALSPYLTLKIPTDAVQWVTRGPTNTTPDRILERALRVNGFKNASVGGSKATYRNK